MSHEVETMAFAKSGGVPWHGLGNAVDPNTSIEAMLKAAGLDWEVNLKPCYAYDEATDTAFPIGRQALVRSSDNKVLTVVGEAWNPLQNRDAMEFFREFTEAGDAHLETAGSLRGGKIVWALAKLNESFTLKGKDKVNGYVLLVSPHEVGSSIKVFTASIRVVCMNTMRASMSKDGRRAHAQHHMKAFDPKAAKLAIGYAREQFSEMKEEAQALSKVALTEFQTTALLAQYFQPMPKEIGQFSDQADFLRRVLNDGPKKDRFAEHESFITKLLNETDEQSKELAGVIASVNNAPGAQPGNGWGVLNGVTHYFDHVAGRSNDARLFNSWLGEKSRVKDQVKNGLMSLV